MAKQIDTQKTLQRRFYRPAEAATELGVDIDSIRQAILRFDGDDCRIPLFYELQNATRIVWAPRERDELAYDRGTLNKGEVRNLDSIGHAEWWDITDGEPGLLISREFSVGPGLWFELNPMHAHDLAAKPEHVFPVNFLIAPPYELGPIPPRAVVMTIAESPGTCFADCWISADDVEAIRSGKSRTPRPLVTRERETLLAMIGVLCELAGHDLSIVTKGHQIANALAPELERRGVRLTGQTVAAKIASARELIAPKGPGAAR